MKFGFSYHHAKLPEHAKFDFERMYSEGLETILIAASEFDHIYWFENMKEIVDIAKEIGMEVWWNFWGFGHVFGGEPPSFFLDKNHKFRQVTAKSQEPIPAACPNTAEFREYLFSWVKKVLNEINIDGIFIDEPHFSTWFPEEYTCTCNVCKNKFKKTYGYEMPLSLTDDVIKFRNDSLVSLVADMGKIIKDTSKNVKVAVCLLPIENPLYGITNYEDIMNIKSIDVISLDPYFLAFGKTIQWAKQKTDELIKLKQTYNKEIMIWLQLYNVPAEEHKKEIELLDYYISKNIDEIFFWSYQANKGTSISSEMPMKLHNKIIEKIRDVKRK